MSTRPLKVTETSFVGPRASPTKGGIEASQRRRAIAADTVNSAARAHNEYLTLLISFGILGLFWSLFSWTWPAWRMGAFKRPLFVCWAIIFTASCFSEDTIETQMGATFFAYFYTLLVFAYPAAAVSAPEDRSPAVG